MTRSISSPEDVGAKLAEAFRSGGYAGASLRTLGDATGLKSASLYHRFPEGKAGMAGTALAHVGAQFETDVIAPLSLPGPVRVRMEQSAQGLRRFYRNGELACLLAVLSLSDAPASVRTSISAAFDRWIDALALALEDRGGANARVQAEDLVSAVQGALILARAGRGQGAFERAVTRLEEAGG